MIKKTKKRFIIIIQITFLKQKNLIWELIWILNLGIIKISPKKIENLFLKLVAQLIRMKDMNMHFLT